MRRRRSDELWKLSPKVEEAQEKEKAAKKREIA